MKKECKRNWLLLILRYAWLPILLIALNATTKLGITIGPSMEPTLHTGDCLIMARWIEPQVGDIVIAQVPGWSNKKYCKRVADIQDGQYYLLGDNYDISLDSRCFGTVGREDILGVSILEIKLGGFVQCVKSFLSQ